jgi:hypothetical protein
MFQERNHRILESDRAVRHAAGQDGASSFVPEPSRRVSDIELFAAMGISTGKT